MAARPIRHVTFSESSDACAVFDDATIAEAEALRTREHWRAHIGYLGVKLMVLNGLRYRFGRDGADPGAWVFASEGLEFLEGLYCEVKASYPPAWVCAAGESSCHADS